MIDYRILPALPPLSDQDLQDQILELVKRSSRLVGQLNSQVQRAIGDLVRSMNCYYSNFLEGHDTHPESIEKALHESFSSQPKQRELQLEARAHIGLQQRIDKGDDPSDWPVSSAYVRWLHKEFCSELPDSMMWVEDLDGGRREHVIPGEWRGTTVRVGQHIPPDNRDMDRLMASFDEAYSPERLSKFQRIASAAAAHHRLVWIHPFLDGNGRVARLMSHAVLLRLGLGSSLWSVSRGLARNADRYLSELTCADSPRMGDLDGRGALSEKMLTQFCMFFFDVCNDQICFMANLLQPQEILRRIRLYVQDEVAARRLPRRSFPLMQEAFLVGEVPRGRAPEITGYGERRARETLSTLIERGLLVPLGRRAPVRLGIPIDVVDRWFPALYPVDSPRLQR